MMSLPLRKTRDHSLGLHSVAGSVGSGSARLRSEPESPGLYVGHHEGWRRPLAAFETKEKTQGEQALRWVDLARQEQGEDHHHPGHHIDEEGDVFEHLLGGALGALAVGQEEEAADAKEGKGDGQHELGPAELGRDGGVGVEGIGGVGGDREPADDDHGPIEGGGVVALEHFALGARSAHQADLVAAFAQCQVEREQEGDQEEPGRDGDLDGEGSGEHAQKKAGGDDAYVDEGDVLELGGVGQIDDEIAGGHQAKPGVEGDGHAQGHDQEAEAEPAGELHWNEAAGDGAVLFDGVSAVGFDIGDIVEQVDRAREQRESQGGADGSADMAEAVEVQGEDHGRQDKGVLHPLVGPQAFEDAFEARGGASGWGVGGHGRGVAGERGVSPRVSGTARTLLLYPAGSILVKDCPVFWVACRIWSKSNSRNRIAVGVERPRHEGRPSSPGTLNQDLQKGIFAMFSSYLTSGKGDIEHRDLTLICRQIYSPAALRGERKLSGLSLSSSPKPGQNEVSNGCV